MVDIVGCMYCLIDDIKNTRNMYTWNNEQKGVNKVFSKLDRVLVNIAWQELYYLADVCFMNEG